MGAATDAARSNPAGRDFTQSELLQLKAWLEAAGRTYLVRRRKAKVAHAWVGEDTACTMASTGGLDEGRYERVLKTHLPLCHMCATAVYRDWLRESGPAAGAV